MRVDPARTSRVERRKSRAESLAASTVRLTHEVCADAGGRTTVTLRTAVARSAGCSPTFGGMVRVHTAGASEGRAWRIASAVPCGFGGQPGPHIGADTGEDHSDVQD